MGLVYFSVSMWIKLDALNNHEFIIAKANSGATTDAFHLRTLSGDLDFTYVNTDTTSYTVKNFGCNKNNNKYLEPYCIWYKFN